MILRKTMNKQHTSKPMLQHRPTFLLSSYLISREHNYPPTDRNLRQSCVFISSINLSTKVTFFLLSSKLIIDKKEIFTFFIKNQQTFFVLEGQQKGYATMVNE